MLEWDSVFAKLFEGYSRIQKMLGRHERRSVEMMDSRHEQFETSRETIEQELRPAV